MTEYQKWKQAYNRRLISSQQKPAVQPKNVVKPKNPKSKIPAYKKYVGINTTTATKTELEQAVKKLRQVANTRATKISKLSNKAIVSTANRKFTYFNDGKFDSQLPQNKNQLKAYYAQLNQFLEWGTTEKQVKEHDTKIANRLGLSLDQYYDKYDSIWEQYNKFLEMHPNIKENNSKYSSDQILNMMNDYIKTTDSIDDDKILQYLNKKFDEDYRNEQRAYNQRFTY